MSSASGSSAGSVVKMELLSPRSLCALGSQQVVDEDEELGVCDGEPCAKCDLLVSEGDKGSLGKKSKQIIHSAWCATYKSVHRKICSCAKFSAWWDAKTDEDKQLYYKERRAPRAKGEKRKLQVVTDTSKELKRSGNQRLVLGNWLPFSVFDSREMMKGEMDSKKRKASWQTLLLDADTKTMEWQGQTLIFEFGGIQTNGVADFPSHVWSLPRGVMEEPPEAMQSDIFEVYQTTLDMLPGLEDEVLAMLVSSSSRLRMRIPRQSTS